MSKLVTRTHGTAFPPFDSILRDEVVEDLKDAARILEVFDNSSANDKPFIKYIDWYKVTIAIQSAASAIQHGLTADEEF